MNKGKKLMSQKAKERWQKIPKLERIEKMRNLAIIKNSKMTLEEKKAHSKKMNDIQYNKSGIFG